MRKYLISLLTLLCMLLPAAALADTFSFAEQGASCTIPDGKYTIITPDNVATQTAWLEKAGKTAEAVLADFTERGVLLQAWSIADDVCLEISAVQDQYASQYYDVNQCTENQRKDYRLGHSSDKTGEWRAQGYDYTSAVWKNYKNAKRFLQLEYVRTVNGMTYRGYARKTVRNGWHVHVDYQVYGRTLKNSDKTALETIMNTWQFVDLGKRPAASTGSGAGTGADAATASRVIFASTPPQETNTGKFTVSGSGTSGLRVIGVVMRMSSSDVHRFETEIDSKGKFSMDVVLPKQGLWTMTYTVFDGEDVVEEGAFDAITYDDTLLLVRLNASLPAEMQLTGKSLTISGTTMKQTKVQCIVDGRYEKSITTNNSGAFSFTFDTSEEGIYNITLAFEKKGYAARRFRCVATREYTEEDRKQVIRDEAVKPSYANLKTKNASYRGRYMVYTLNIREVIQTSTGYMTFAGMSKTKAGVYKDIVAIRTTEEPVWREGTAVHMYLKCLGMYDVVSEDGTNSYPYFDLQFVE
ncbi:MAG: hypothetical protein PUC00_12800 [Clostridiales bacterium]|nr:hypothetical protein [Clostridiales bacterium]